MLQQMEDLVFQISKLLQNLGMLPTVSGKISSPHPESKQFVLEFVSPVVWRDLQYDTLARVVSSWCSSHAGLHDADPVAHLLNAPMECLLLPSPGVEPFLIAAGPATLPLCRTRSPAWIPSGGSNHLHWSLFVGSPGNQQWLCRKPFKSLENSTNPLEMPSLKLCRCWRGLEVKVFKANSNSGLTGKVEPSHDVLEESLQQWALLVTLDFLHRKESAHVGHQN